ncbi:MAG TPA: cyclopropane-fatty-acyl-phospholipid synthase family protein [Terriglobales bacterium]
MRAAKAVIALQTLKFLRELLSDYHPRNFELELWDGTRWQPEANQFRRFTWKINSPGAVRTTFTSASQLALAEAYICGDFDIDGDIESIFPLADYLSNLSGARKLQLGALLLMLPYSPSRQSPLHAATLHGRAHTKRRDRQSIQYHYDVSNDFYRLWLDPNMVYSCAYFKDAHDDLATAQIQKLDYICRKLRLKPGERLLDIGCGWGGLILHAARHYGVKALGITLSEQQFALANEHIQQENLSDRCEVKLIDYREIHEPESFDKISSVGMVEHVGERNLEEYFRCAYRLLRPKGAFFNHGIGIPKNYSKQEGPTFADLYVFPDGELVPIGRMTRAAESAGFEVRDVENLREHYALTLHHWVRRMAEHSREALRIVDEATYRIWRLHMAGSAYYFETDRLNLYQTLLVKSQSGASNLPLTRADWYA